MRSRYFEFVCAADLPASQLHAAFGAAFSDYLIGPFTLPLEQWPTFLGRQAVDLMESRVAMRAGSVLAFAFVAVREDVPGWRLATMGAVPQARGSGAAPALLDDFIARTREAGCAFAELECFEQNERALRLYRGRGFQATSPLYGYSWKASGAAASQGASVALEAAFDWLENVARERGDLPLQVTPVSLRALPVKLQALRLGSAQLVFSENAQGLVTFNSLVDRNPAQRDAQALASGFADRNCSVPQLQRPDVGGEALERAGFERQPLNQVLMRLVLRGAAG